MFLEYFLRLNLLHGDFFSHLIQVEILVLSGRLFENDGACHVERSTSLSYLEGNPVG